MSQPKICLITPSYAPDFERCKLLSETKNIHNRSELKHYIVVDKNDFALFNQLKKSDTVIITKEELLPNWLVKMPFFNKKNIWFNWKGLPVRGWLVQQLIKLAIAEYIEEEVLVFADSDVFFIRDFDLNRFIKEDKVRFFAQPDQVNIDNPHLPRWYYDASNLLNLEKPQFPVSNYMGQLVFWRKDNVIKLHRHLEQKNHRPWIEAICANWNVSEYILYGVFVEQILKDTSGHYIDNCDLCHNYWEEESLHTNQLQNFFANISSESIAAMLSAKADIPIANYSHLLQSF
jgi:hypothetical protein